jgi:putative toxin-antitoxin system antitoxin component (TIGR02293 family)
VPTTKEAHEAMKVLREGAEKAAAAGRQRPDVTVREMLRGHEASDTFGETTATSQAASEAAGLVQDVEDQRLGKVANLLGGRKVLRRQPATQLEAHEMLSDGLPARSMKSLVGHLSILGRSTEPSLAKVLGTSLRTIQRQKNAPNKRLSPEQSGRMWKFAEVLAKATDVFGSQSDAEQWMQRPAMGLDGRRPIDLLLTPPGTELVEDFLERIEQGIYT